MGDSYQAIYDAVRSKISGGNIGQAVEEVARRAFDISNYTDRLYQEFSIAAAEMQRPCVVFKPELRKSCDSWIASFGTDIFGYGASPDEAMRDFDKKWHEKKGGAA